MRYVRALEAALELVRASLDLRLRPNARTVALLGTIHGQNPPDQAVSASKLREARRVGGPPFAPGANLSRQALAVQRMLRRRNIPCRLRLGVAIGTAHAWVTVADHPVVGQSGLECLIPLAAFD